MREHDLTSPKDESLFPKSTVVKPAESVFGETVLDDRFYPVTKQLSQRLSAFGSFQFEIGFVTMKARPAKLEDE